jgi:hypothetical protein
MARRKKKSKKETSVKAEENKIRLIIEKHLHFLNNKNLQFVLFNTQTESYEWEYYLESEDFNIWISIFRDQVRIALIPSWHPDWISNQKYDIALEYLIGYTIDDLFYEFYENRPYGLDAQLEIIAEQLRIYYADLRKLMQKDYFLQHKTDLESYLNKRITEELSGFPFERIVL